MTETRPLDSTTATVLRGLRRRAGAPALIDGAAARRLHARTAGWAMRRMAQASALAARHAPADGDGATTEMLLARHPATRAGEDSSGVSLPASAAGHVVQGEGNPGRRAASAALAPEPSRLAARLQRRSLGAGLLTPTPIGGAARPAAVSLRSELRERLTARAAPAHDPIMLALASDIDAVAARRVAGVDRGGAADGMRPPTVPQHAATAVTPPDARIEAGRLVSRTASATDGAPPLRMRRNEQAHLARSPVTSPATTGASLPVIRIDVAPPPQAASPIAQRVRSGDRGEAGGHSGEVRAHDRTAAAVAMPMDVRVVHRRTVVERAVATGGPRPPMAPEHAATAVTPPAVRLESGGMVSRVATDGIAFVRRFRNGQLDPAATRATHATAGLPLIRGAAAPGLAMPFLSGNRHEATQSAPVGATRHVARATSDSMYPPLIVASGPDAAYGMASAAAVTTHVGGRSNLPAGDPAPQVRAAAAPGTAAVTGGLIWRSADNPTRDREVGRGELVTHAGAEDRPRAAAETEPSRAESPIRPDVPACAGPQPVPDMNRLADAVMRLIVRRIHIERERGGKPWN
jgi:hypothetical protein